MHTVLRGTAYVMGRPREVVVRRVAENVVVEPIDGLEVEVEQSSWATPD